MLNSRRKKFKIDGHVEIQKQSAFEEAEKTLTLSLGLTVSNFTEGLGLIDAGVEVVEDVE